LPEASLWEMFDLVLTATKKMNEKSLIHPNLDKPEIQNNNLKILNRLKI
jgi:hypothetical protein